MFIDMLKSVDDFACALPGDVLEIAGFVDFGDNFRYLFRGILVDL